MQKIDIPGGLWVVGIMAGILALGGCSDVFQGPQEEALGASIQT
jgi:hypothetical protein